MATALGHPGWGKSPGLVRGGCCPDSFERTYQHPSVARYLYHAFLDWSMKIRHAEVWKNRPKEKDIFVSRIVPRLLPLMRKHKVRKVLDAACGNGMGCSIPLLQAGFDVKAFDNARSAISAVKQNAKEAGYRLEVENANMYGKWPYDDGAFDAVTCFKAIHHGRLENIMSALSEAKRVLRKGGIFYATMIRHEDMRYDTKRKLHYFHAKSHVTGKRIKAYAKQDRTQPHLFYYLSKDWEYMVPHYFASRDELKAMLRMYFREIRVTAYKEKPLSVFWLLECRK
jgi:2-polyprenyl-3-methyl-5-hydroxy-6-metoxy-1,4-benzoquinol methylase